jgi:polysaccharide biosynthesis/export protein
MRRARPLIFLSVLFSLSLQAQSHSDFGSQAPAKRPIAEIPIGAGDLLDVAVFGSEDFHPQVRVSSSGEINLPLVGSLHVAGLSPELVRELIQRKLREGNFYKSPQVSVFVKEYGTENIYVLGEVQKPGSYSILSAQDVLQALALAGGTTPKAGRTVTISNPARPQEISLDLTGKTEQLKANTTLLPGDTILVSKAGVVYVIGDVRLPTAVVMDNPNLTVLQAIAVAQGTNPTASLDSAKLIRRGLGGPVERPLPLRKMLTAEVHDIPVQADDIIFVPTSRAKAFTKRSLEAIIQAATGVAMYARY